MELDSMSLGIGLLLVMVQIIGVLVVVWVTNNRVSAGVKKILNGQQTIMSFMAKDYQDRALLKIQERTAPPANGSNQAEVLKAVGACLQDEVKAGTFIDHWPKIIASFSNGIMPNKNGSGAAAPVPPTGPGAADPPAPAKSVMTGNNNPNGMAALKAINEKRKAESAAKKAAKAAAPPAPPVQAPANDNDEELASLLEQHGYKVTRGSEETLKAIKDQAADQGVSQ